MEDIKVSVCCLVYNHEKYLRQCLDSILMQETNFKYEILIHDDASTDGSADIIREYERKFPDIIKPIYQTENQYSKKIQISWTYQYPRVKGKYLAWCEGDDFWCDSQKLQMQYDILEQNSKCVFCAHTVQEVFEDGIYSQEMYPNFNLEEGILEADRWMECLLSQNKYIFQTSSYFLRKEVIMSKIRNIPQFVLASPVGDYPLMMLAAIEGDAYYIKKPMSCYRKGSNGSWSSTVFQNNKRRINTYKKAIVSYQLYKEESNHRFDTYVDVKIAFDEFRMYGLMKDYKKMLKSKYKFLMNQQTLKEKLYIYIFGYMPWLKKPYEKGKQFFRNI